MQTTYCTVYKDSDMITGLHIINELQLHPNDAVFSKDYKWNGHKTTTKVMNKPKTVTAQNMIWRKHIQIGQTI